MAKKVDYSDLQKLEKKYKRMAQSKSGITSRKVMNQALKPALEVMEQIVPQPTGSTSLTPRKRKAAGERHPYSTGALKSTLRARSVRDSPDEIKGLVGSRKKMMAQNISNRSAVWNAGNRAHLSEFGPITGIRFWRHTPFAEPTGRQTKGLVEQRLDMGLNQLLKDEFRNEQ